MTTTRKLVGLCVCGLVVGSAAARAQAVESPIIWSAASTIAGDTDVNTAGALVAAYNIGNTGVPSATINGVTFASFPIADGSSGATNSTLSVFGFSSQPVTTSLGLGSGGGTFSGLSPDYQTMLSTGAVKPAFIQILDLRLLGLTVGNAYTVQLWVNDSGPAAGNPAASRRVSDFFGNMRPMDANTSDAAGGVGQHVQGSFTALDTSVFVSVHGAIVDGGSDGAVLNGLQLRTTAVPEPATLGMLAFAANFFLMRRFKRAKVGLV